MKNMRKNDNIESYSGNQVEVKGKAAIKINKIL